MVLGLRRLHSLCAPFHNQMRQCHVSSREHKQATPPAELLQNLVLCTSCNLDARCTEETLVWWSSMPGGCTHTRTRPTPRPSSCQHWERVRPNRRSAPSRLQPEPPALSPEALWARVWDMQATSVAGALWSSRIPSPYNSQGQIQRLIAWTNLGIDTAVDDGQADGNRTCHLVAQRGDEAGGPESTCMGREWEARLVARNERLTVASGPSSNLSTISMNTLTDRPEFVVPRPFCEVL